MAITSTFCEVFTDLAQACLEQIASWQENSFQNRGTKTKTKTKTKTEKTKMLDLIASWLHTTGEVCSS